MATFHMHLLRIAGEVIHPFYDPFKFLDYNDSAAGIRTKQTAIQIDTNQE
ncbi:MAG: hypothetical protein DKINENOH_01719 [bacterium]|nr:hypothetical protein [bacterium]